MLVCFCFVSGSVFVDQVEADIVYSIRYVHVLLWFVSSVILPFLRIHGMMTSSNGSIFRVIDPLCGEFIDHR